MPGICGIASQQESDFLPDELNRMLDPLIRRDSDTVARASMPRAVLGGVGFVGENTLASQPGIWLAATGLVSQREELIQRVRNETEVTAEPQTLAELLLALYQRYGVDGVTGLNGTYSLAIWEATPRRLTVVTDPLGTANLYYFRTTGRLMFASEYKALAWHPKLRPAVDAAALVDLFMYEQVMLDRTFFLDIRSLPPASVMVWEDGQVDIRSYWNFPSAATGELGTREEWAARLADAICEGVRRRAYPNTLLFLTGGLDSRVLADSLQSVAPQLPVHTATIGPEGCSDVVVGRQIAERLGYPYTRINLDDTYLARYAAKAAWRAEGKLNAFASWIYAAEPFMLDHGLQYAMTGVIGNVISGRHYPPGLTGAHSIPEAEDVIWRDALKGSLDKVANIMRPEIYRTAAEESASAFMETFRRMDTPNLLNRFDHLYLYTVISRLATKTDVFGDAGYGVDPFMDLDVIRTALRMPPNLRAGGQFYKQMIVDHFPKAASVIHDRSGILLSDEVKRGSETLVRRLVNLERRVERRLWPANDRRMLKRCVRTNEAIRTGSRKFILDTLSQEQYLDDFFNIGAVRRLVIDHIEGRRNEYALITGLVTFVLWRQMFADRNSPLYAYPSGVTGPLRSTRPLEAGENQQEN